MIEIVSVSTFDSANAETIVDTADYLLYEQDSRWPRAVAVSGTWGQQTTRIEYRAGYVDLSVSPQETMALVPHRIKQAIMLYCEAMDDRDKDMMEKLVCAAERLLRIDKCDLSMA